MISKLGRIQKSFNLHSSLPEVVKTIGLHCLLLATTVALAGLSFAQSGQQNTTATNAGNVSLVEATKSTANAEGIVKSSPVKAAESSAPTDEAAKDAAQNPLAKTISIPFQNDTYFNVGPNKSAVNALIVEPVIPIRLSENWNLITRTITPIIYDPRLSPTLGSVAGLGNIEPQFYFSPSHPGPGRIIWGVGPQLWLPTATDDRLGVNKFGGGPAGVIVTSRGHWMFGSMINNVWTGENKQHQKMNELTLNPFVFYNLRKGWYVMSSPILTADWTARPDQKWTVPVGGGVGRVFKLGFQPMNARVQFWKDVKQPTGGPGWTMQAQIQFLFPRK